MTFEANQLWRFDFDRSKNKLSFDCSRNLKGRGAYVVQQREQLIILFKKRLLNRSFKTNFDQSVYQKLKQEVESCLNIELQI